jgi:hypothetical protein
MNHRHLAACRGASIWRPHTVVRFTPPAWPSGNGLSRGLCNDPAGRTHQIDRITPVPVGDDGAGHRPDCCRPAVRVRRGARARHAVACQTELVRSYLGLGSAPIWLGMRYVCDPRISNPGFEVARTWIVSVLALASDGEPSDRLPALRPNAQTEAEAVGPSWDVTERQSCRRPRYRCLNGTTR